MYLTGLDFVSYSSDGTSFKPNDLTFYETVRDKGVCISNLYLDSASDKLVVEVGMALKYKGKVSCMLIADIDALVIDALMKDIKIGERGRCYILSKT